VGEKNVGNKKGLGDFLYTKVNLRIKLKSWRIIRSKPNNFDKRLKMKDFTSLAV